MKARRPSLFLFFATLSVIPAVPAGEIGEDEYMALVARLLDAPAWLGDWPRQEWDPNDPGPRRAVVLRLVVGEEEHVRQALRGEPYETLRGLADMVMEFAITAQAKP